MPDKGDQMNEESDEISLQPFSHQVGGHYAMMQLDDHSVCKPLNETELLFYKTAPDAIKEFVPKFKGTLDLNKSGTVASGSTALGTKPDSLCIKDDEDRIASGSRTSYNNGRNQERCWTKSDFMKPKIARRMTESNEFLVLENVVARFRRPSIIDIKMGTRQHGDDATRAKIDRQQAKCAFTTSSDLGLRICGMKVYLHSKSSYMHRDKYFGRRLTAETFKTGLLEYFQPIIDVGMTSMIRAFLKRLGQLRALIEKQETYRFYSSSLLFVYDAEADRCSLDDAYDDCIDVRMIDFAHSTNAGDGSGRVHEGPDKGYLFGLENLIRFLEDIFCEFGRCSSGSSSA